MSRSGMGMRVSSADARVRTPSDRPTALSGARRGFASDERGPPGRAFSSVAFYSARGVEAVSGGLDGRHDGHSVG